ncbi:hypothetical protein CYY_004470 [Polysphondylium violaceum]|uniref:Dienelactone hydrolase domain-containing protein n=1 Tax=Polysphondylium violaceum TaxID=133409 RepID=A0A8J4PX03_9MYCE|nr:hypothetical protein CYY_004470 [Polysphondylium violaceum]
MALNSGYIDIKINDLECDCYVTRPKDTSKPLPIVICLMDIFGLRPAMEYLGQKIAQQGYFVIQPNLFYRSARSPIIEKLELLGNKDTIGEASCTVRGFSAKCDKNEVLSDLRAIMDHLAASATYSSITVADKVGLVGFCFGGGLAMRAANEFSEVKAAASIHSGRLALPDVADSPYHFINNIKATLYFGHAENDASIPLDQIELLNKTLSDAKINYSSEIYTGCEHGWTMNDLYKYNKEGTDKVLLRLSELFSSNLQ